MRYLIQAIKGQKKSQQASSIRATSAPFLFSFPWIETGDNPGQWLYYPLACFAAFPFGITIIIINMARSGKRKSKAPAAETETPRKGRQPKVVDSVEDEDDEEIEEDEAFNSEDERMYGRFFEDKTIKRRQGDDSSDEEKGDEITSEEDGDDDDDADDDSDEDDEDDGGQYMLNLLDKLDTASHQKKADDKPAYAVEMAKLPESEYSSSISKKGLTLDNLMEGLQDTQGFKNLQKAFSKQQSATPAPLDKVVADRTQRKLTYENQSKNVSRWTKVVQENRQAETLDFKPKERLNVTRDTLVDKFEPTTEFEKELEQALEEAGQQDEEAVLKAEEQALQDDLGANRLTMEEYKKRRGQLAQIRALMFYHEQKRHHIKKIKSKKYRRIRKKQRERLKESALEAAMEDDAELAKELKEKEEVSRIQERMTLAHKNTSKWAKRVLKRGRNVDVETRRALSAQVKRGDDLRRKMMGDDKSDSDNDSDEDLVESARKVLEDTDEAVDPTNGKSGLFKLSFMQKGMMKQRDKARDEARRLLTELQSNEGEDMDENNSGDNSNDDEIQKKPVIASDKEMKAIMKRGEMVATSLEFGNANSISMSAGIEIDVSGQNAKKDDGGGEGTSERDSNDRRLKVVSEHVTTLSTDKQSRKNETPNKSTTSKQKKTVNKEQKPTEVSTKSAGEDDEANPWLQITDEDSKPTTAKANLDTKKKPSKKGMVDVQGAADILDSGSDEVKARSSKEVGGSKDPEPNDGVEKKITMLSQEELIRRAFATTSEKEADEEFQKEKEEMAIENDPTRKVVSEKGPKEVAGWGSWAGAGAPPPPRRRTLPKKLQAPLKKDESKRKRQDEGKPDVIINQKRLRRMANTFMLGDVPHPYSSRAEYEQSMLGGVGREWNVTSSFKNMTRPEILTRSGKIIQPISKKAKVARAPAKF